MNDPIVIVSAARTAMGSFQGGFASLTAANLGAVAIKAAVERAGCDANLIEEVLMGCVLQAGQGQAPARQAALQAGLPLSAGCATIHKVCGSAMKATMLGHDGILAGSYGAAVVGGMESMTRAPHLLPGGRQGVKYGSWQMLDAAAHDALTCALEGESMGTATERFAARDGITRSEQDAFAERSHRLASAAAKDGVFAEEIAPVVIPQRRGETLIFSHDEGVRADTTVDSLARLRPAFADGGSITAGNSSQISDGAAAMVVMSKAKAEALGLAWIAEIVATAAVAGPDASLLPQPANAITRALDTAGLTVGDLSLFELNEAFAAQSLAVINTLGLDTAKVNPMGGAIALGHPLGATGAIRAATLVHALQREQLKYGMVTMCIGMGQGAAGIFERV